MTIATGIFLMVALTVVGTLAAAVVFAVVTRGRDWWRDILSLRVLPFVFMGLAVGATTFGIGLVERDSAEEALRLSVADIEADCDDQLTLLLHVNASDLANRYAASNGLPHAEMVRLAEYYCFDELTVVSADGRIVDTTDPGTKTGAPFFTDVTAHAPYRELLNGQRTTVRQRFRPSATRPDLILKYFALTLPDGGFLQIGYLWDTFEHSFARFFLPIFETRTVGETGFCVVLDREDTIDVAIPGHPEFKGRPALEIGFTPENLAVPLGKIFRARLFGTLCRCLAYPEAVAGRRIIAAVPLAERQGPTIALACGVTFVLLAVFLVFRLVLRLFRMQQSKIDALRAVEEERRARDMALAREVQRAELRTDGTQGDGYRLRAVMNAAREVGGDFYDYYELPDGRLVLTIADVSGKGIPAAFFMMKARLTLKSCIYSCVTNLVDADVASASSPLAAAVARANVRLARNNPAEMFVTAWIGIYDPNTGTLDYVSAGHNPPLIRHVAGEGQTCVGHTSNRVEWLAAPRCAALGVFEGAKYRSAQTSLASGDRIFLYTDGVTEAMNAAGELFGNDRLEATLREAGHPLIPAVTRALDAFSAGAEQSDDITMLEMKIETNVTDARNRDGGKIP